MPLKWNEIQYRWNKHTPVKGVAFLPNDRALIAGQAGRTTATVVALRAVGSEREYEVEFPSGDRLVRAQSELASVVPDDTNNCIAWIQKWYAAQCDDDWEHQHGVEIGTLDNPGWSVKIDLKGTDLVNRVFEPIERLEPERAWLSCKVAENRFEGAGGPHRLGEILGTFVRWARGQPAPAHQPLQPTSGAAGESSSR